MSIDTGFPRGLSRRQHGPEALEPNQDQVRRIEMKTASIVGILLIVLGVISLGYQGINYTTQKKVLDVGPIQATKEEHKTIPLPPIIGGIALVGGIALLFANGKNS
jgi:uncharacterized membrane protein